MDRKFSKHKHGFGDDKKIEAKVLPDLDYGARVPLASKATALPPVDASTMYENVLLESNRKRLQFFDSFFSADNKHKIGRIKLTSPRDCTIITFEANDRLCYSKEAHELAKMLGSVNFGDGQSTLYSGYRAIFDGDDWGDSLEDYKRFLYTKGVLDIAYLSNISLYDMEALLKYYLTFESKRENYAISGWRPKEDEASRKVAALIDRHGNVLYWNQAKMPSSFNIDFLRMAASQFEKTFDDASNYPEGIDVFKYFYDNPMPNLNLIDKGKELTLVNEDNADIKIIHK